MENKTQCDVVIVSFAKTEELKLVTEQGIESLLQSEDNIQFNVFVVESNKEVNYNRFDNTKTIYTDETFGYNKFLNIGIKEGKSEYIFLANNDLIYEKNWCTAIIEQMKLNPELLSASPFCPQTQNPTHWQGQDVFYGYEIRRHFSGWALFCQRKIFKITGELPTAVDFWFSDNLWSDVLQYHKILHGLCIRSIVHHHEFNLGKTGSSILDDAKKQEYCMGQQQKYLQARQKLFSTPK